MSALPMLVSPTKRREEGVSSQGDFTKIKNEMLRMQLSRQQIEHEVQCARNRVDLLKVCHARRRAARSAIAPPRLLTPPHDLSHAAIFRTTAQDSHVQRRNR